MVLLRDPIERFRSAMRLGVTRRRSQPYPIPVNVQTWAGCYADQLDMWELFVDRKQLHVLVYEEVREDPQAAMDALWARLDLEPVPLTSIDVASRSSADVNAVWEWPEGMREALRALYRLQSRRLVDDWGLDVSRWESLA